MIRNFPRREKEEGRDSSLSKAPRQESALESGDGRIPVCGGIQSRVCLPGLGQVPSGARETSRIPSCLSFRIISGLFQNLKK